METKSFVTCYDSDCEKYAELLMTLVSMNDKIKNINFLREEFKKNKGIVSTEYVLTIGKEGSAVNSQHFPPNKYDSYGIQIGVKGRKAWIVCNDFNWTIESEHEFLKEMTACFEALNMKTEDIEKERKEIEKFLNREKKIEKEDKNEKRSLIKDIISIPASIVTIPYDLYIISYFWASYLADVFKDKTTRRYFQYKYAVSLFYKDFIEDFLQVKEQNKKEELF